MKTHKKLVASVMLIALVTFMPLGMSAANLSAANVAYCNDHGHGTTAMKACCALGCATYNHGSSQTVIDTCTNNCTGSAA
jgi:hypothetical protein